MTKFLGVLIDESLNWKHHISRVKSKQLNVGIMYRYSKVLDRYSIHMLYSTLCLPYLLYLTRFLTRFAIQAKGPDGKWTRKPLAYRESNNVHLLITRPPEICVNLVFKHIHAASSYTICRQLVPFIYCPLCERVLPDVQSTLILY